MATPRPLFRADHVGSLLRPSVLKALRLLNEEGAQGGYEKVADVIFNQMPYDGFFLELDDARSGDFAPVRHAPPHVRVVLGLVTSKVGALERKDDVKRRLDEAARYLPLDQLCFSPQCGFSSTLEGNEVAVDHQQAKLALCVEVAREVWGGL
jgi:5-methyltetrahydropteroyltriglutamate--homocysteine methyltransferase